MFPIEKYHRAASVEDAIQALAADPTARVIAGGTDVLVRLHGGNRDYGSLVDINGIEELRQIRMEPDGAILIGALATCTEIIEHPLIAENLPMLAQSLATIGGPQIRNTATMGGNICNGAVSADSACAALVYEFDLVIQGRDGERTESIHGFHTGPGRTILRHDDVLKYFLIRPENYKGIGAAYTKYAMRGAMDIATIGCGAAVQLNDDGATIDQLKLAFAVAAPTPIRCPRAEQAVQGKTFNDETLAILAQAVEHDVRPRTSWRAEKEFRLHIIRTLAGRVTREAAANVEGTSR
jgi:xanthine dehydrogenase FAD-binding subunit